MLVDFFIIKKQKVEPEDMLVDSPTSAYWFTNGFNISALIVWFIGIALYNVFAYFFPVFGACVPTFLIIGLLYLVVAKAKSNRGSSNEQATSNQ
jgi:cytosine/uracil/thiamine/allantoin permease